MRIGPRDGVLLGTNLGRAIVTSGDFTAYVCDSAATRPSSQITLGRLVFVFVGPVPSSYIAFSVSTKCPCLYYRLRVDRH